MSPRSGFKLDEPLHDTRLGYRDQYPSRRRVQLATITAIMISGVPTHDHDHDPSRRHDIPISVSISPGANIGCSDDIGV